MGQVNCRKHYLSLRKSLVLYVIAFVVLAVFLSVTTFSICDGAAEGISASYPPSGEKYYLTNLTGVNVLLAEDNELNAEIATVQLEEFGMNVERAVDGKNAVEIFRNHPKGTFDVILMDVMMPEMNGYEATKAIRAMNDRPDGKNIPIIAMTANSFAEDVQASLDAGMNAHLSKPIVMDEVIKTILRYVR